MVSLTGRDPQPLESYLPRLIGLGPMLKGKVYLGCSMGAFVASEQYVLTFDKDEPAVHRGLGLLPIKTLCHWDVETRKDLKLDLLRKDSPELPILTLDECRHAVLIR